MKTFTSIRMTVYASLMAALIAVGAYISIPVGPVPIVLQNLFVMLAGLLLKSRWGTVSVGVYLFAGALGFPVFSGGTGGIGRIIGPTGGYLIGFLPAVFLIGVISARSRNRATTDVIAMIVGSAVIYAFGITWLKIQANLTLEKALVLGMYPFLLGDALKIAAAVPLARMLRPIIKS